jgi:recombination protein RecT
MATNELVASVISRIDVMKAKQGLALPADYSVANALNAAWLMITDDTKGPSLASKTTQQSQAQALLNMAIQGLSPSKSQGYFIPYGRQLSFQRSYFGSVQMLRRLSNVNDVWANVVHQDDEFEIDSSNGRLIVSKFKPKFENIDKPIIGAFAVIEMVGGGMDFTVMTKKEIDVSWSQAKTKKVQNEFPGEMAKRTVLNRAAKMFINTSGDNDALIKAVNDTTADEYDNSARRDVTEQANSVEFDQAREQIAEQSTVISPDVPTHTAEPLTTAAESEPEPATTKQTFQKNANPVADYIANHPSNTVDTNTGEVKGHDPF